jgi:hypothetical protein
MRSRTEVKKKAQNLWAFRSDDLQSMSMLKASLSFFGLGFSCFRPGSSWRQSWSGYIRRFQLHHTRHKFFSTILIKLDYGV